MKTVDVLAVIQAKNKDLVIRLAMNESFGEAMPGQYINFSLSENAQSIPAYVFVVNPAYFEIYLLKRDAEKLAINTSPKKLFVSHVLGDIFLLPKNKINPLLIADELGLPSIIFLAEKIKSISKLQPLVFLCSSEKTSFPFTPVPSQFVVSNFPMGVLAACPMLEDKGIPSRLISEKLMPGCFDGNMTELLRELPDAFFDEAEIEVFVAGKKEILDDVKVFANKRDLKLQSINCCDQSA